MPANAVGIGPLSSIARDMTRGSRFAEGGEAELDFSSMSAEQLRGRIGSGEIQTKEEFRQARDALNSVQEFDVEPLELTWAGAANTAIDFTPIIGDIKGGIEGAEIISEELKTDSPNWRLIGMVGGAAVLGVIPFVGDAAKKMIMKGAQGFKKPPKNDVYVLTEPFRKFRKPETPQEAMSQMILNMKSRGQHDLISEEMYDAADISFLSENLPEAATMQESMARFVLQNRARGSDVTEEMIAAADTDYLANNALTAPRQLLSPESLNMKRNARGVPVRDNFEDIYNPSLMKADGGEIMNGIGSLNETARNMTRGPRGIGAYQQYAPGGEVLRPQSRPPQMRPQSRPPEMRPQSRPPEMQEMAEIRSYLDGLPEEGTVAPPEKYFEINSYDIDGETKEAIDFKDGMRMFMPDVENMIKGNQTATEPMVGKETAAEVLEFLQENNPTSQEFIDYFSSARLAMGGEALGPPPMRGPDPQGIQQFADGGPPQIRPQSRQTEIESSSEGLPPLSEYRRALIMSESSGRSGVVNEKGYMGLTQAGDDALIDFKKASGLAFTNEEYLDDPGLQMRFQDWYEQTTINFVMDKGLDQYIGRVIKGVPITMSSLLGMAHLGGNNGMKDFLESGGRYDRNDGNTSLSDYGAKFANMAIYGESGGENFNVATPEDIAMSMPVEQEGSLQYFRPQARPEGMGFSAPLTSLRPQARPTLEPKRRPQSSPLALPEGRSMVEKYGLPGDMPQGGIISAIR